MLRFSGHLHDVDDQGRDLLGLLHDVDDQVRDLLGLLAPGLPDSLQAEEAAAVVVCSAGAVAGPGPLPALGADGGGEAGEDVGGDGGGGGGTGGGPEISPCCLHSPCCHDDREQAVRSSCPPSHLYISPVSSCHTGTQDNPRLLLFSTPVHSQH